MLREALGISGHWGDLPEVQCAYISFRVAGEAWSLRRRQRAASMSATGAPGDAQGDADRDDPSGDLRSVLVTSVLNLEPLDEDLFR